MNQLEYIFGHAIPTGWQTINAAFRMWKDLMIGDYSSYVLSSDENPFEACRDWFWITLGADEVLPKAFLEELQEMIGRIDSGEEKLIAFSVDEATDLDKLLEEFKDGDV